MLSRGNRYFLVSDLRLRGHLNTPDYKVNKTKTRPNRLKLNPKISKMCDSFGLKTMLAKVII